MKAEAQALKEAEATLETAQEDLRVKRAAYRDAVEKSRAKALSNCPTVELTRNGDVRGVAHIVRKTKASVWLLMPGHSVAARYSRKKGEAGGGYYDPWYFDDAVVEAAVLPRGRPYDAHLKEVEDAGA